MARDPRPAVAASALSPADLEAIRDKLAELRLRAQAALDRAEGDLKGEDAELFRDLGATGDWAVAEAEFERDMAGAAQARGLLALVKAAEQRLRSGEYGSCDDCGEPIDFARLAATPTASRCIKCQAARERPGHGPVSR